MATTEEATRPVSSFTYDDVQAVLTKAGSGSNPGNLIGLSLPQFLSLRLYGLRLVEPEQASSCCGRSARGSSSTLIRALRGEPPFDGTQFPRLPWGGSAVSEDDIARISDWIDAGCPGSVLTTNPVAGEVSIEGRTRVEMRGLAGPIFNLATDPAAWRYAKGEPRQRVDVDNLNEAQQERLRQAFRELYRLNKWSGDKRSYNNLALIHQNHCQHGWERFLPWHRIYLYEFEQALQDFCPEVTLPWWDFPARRYNPSDPAKGAVLPDSFKGFLNEAAVDFLHKNGFPKSAEKLLGQLWTTPSDIAEAVTAACGAKYAQGENRKRLIDALLDTNALWYPLRYSGQFGSGTINTVIHYHYPTQDDIDEIMALRTFRDFGGGSLYVDSFGFLDQNPHNTMHIWTGGINPAYNPKIPADRNRAVKVAGRNFHKRDDLYSEPEFGDMFSNLTTSYDPIFWPIHANIDRLWWNWQQTHPDGLPADLDSALTPWSYSVRDTLDMHRFGYEYVRGSSIIPVGMTTTVGRFVSAPIAVAAGLRGNFRSVEVRLHRVPQLLRSCFIRVFLNTPDADASTPLTVDGYGGYAAIFGHGECYGGPGHCDLPPEENRKFDRRGRSMNAPRNHRIDVTRAARRLLAAGAKELVVSLVVIGASYEEDLELLRLDGVSLNFLD